MPQRNLNKKTSEALTQDKEGKRKKKRKAEKDDIGVTGKRQREIWVIAIIN